MCVQPFLTIPMPLPGLARYTTWIPRIYCVCVRHIPTGCSPSILHTDMLWALCHSSVMPFCLHVSTAVAPCSLVHSLVLVTQYLHFSVFMFNIFPSRLSYPVTPSKQDVPFYFNHRYLSGMFQGVKTSYWAFRTVHTDSATPPLPPRYRKGLFTDHSAVVPTG